MNPRRQVHVFLLFVAAVVGFWAIPARAGEQWLPVTDEDLSLKQVPQFPGAHALILYRSVDRHDDQGYEEDYVRIKILREEGKRYANVETPPFVREYGLVGDIKARTIKPDGSVVPFTGPIHEKLILKNNSFKEVSLTFTMPDVQVGSIIEYRYKQRFAIEWAEQYGTEWRVQDELFVKHAEFSLRPSARLRLKWVASHLLNGAAPRRSGGSILLTVENVPPFEPEEYTPPETELRARVYFFYAGLSEPDRTDEYWKKNGEQWKRKAEKFMEQHSALNRELAAVLMPEDVALEAKMRRLYARVQQIRNLSWEADKSKREEEREKLRQNGNVEDVLRHGYGTQDEVNRLYAALLREAGIYAALIRVSEREESFFHEKIPLWDQLDSEMVIARDGAREYFLDPGTPYCPFGELPWQRTAVLGWRSDTMTWGEVPGSKPDSTTETRTAQLSVGNDGALTGTIQVSFTGQAALGRRLSARNDDDKEKKANYADEVREWLPSGSRVQVVAMDGWTNADIPLTINLEVAMNGFGAGYGDRMLLPISLLHSQDTHPFQEQKRANSVYFHFPFRNIDDITITFERGSKVDATPSAREVHTSFGRYNSSMSQSGSTIHIARELTVENLMISVEDYPKLQHFYAIVKEGDSEQLVLRLGTRD